MNLFNNSYIVLFTLFFLITCVNSNKTNDTQNQDDDITSDDNDSIPKKEDGDDSAKSIDDKVHQDDDGTVKPDDDNKQSDDVNSAHQDIIIEEQDDKEVDEEDTLNEEDLITKFNSGIQHEASNPWPYGVVPYKIDKTYYDTIISSRIRSAMETIMGSSCVKFLEPKEMPKGSKYKKLIITNPNNERDCSHSVGTSPNWETVLVLGYDCMRYRDILHSLMHVLGFKDEVTHPQRSQFIRIMWENIRPKYRPLFHIDTGKPPHKSPVEYDTRSIMHFHDRAFTANGGATIAPVIPGLVINPTDRLSQLDIMKLRLAYGHQCNTHTKMSSLLATCGKHLEEDAGSPPDRIPQQAFDPVQVLTSDSPAIESVIPVY